MYNYYPTNQQPAYRMPQQQPMVGLKGRPVSSIEEARAATIDFDGSIFFFPDLANKKIYTKQINIDGTMSLNMYEIKEIPTEQEIINPNIYVTREEFENAISQLKENMPVPAQPISTPTSGKQFECNF